MKRILLLLFVIGLTASAAAMTSMNSSRVRKETRFLTDKMAHELGLSTIQYNDIYEINYDFINSVGDIMNYVVRGEEWATDDYYEALDIRNDDLRWVLNERQYRRFIGADYFYRPIYVTGGRWSFRVYINYPNRSLFYFGVPHHYRTYCGAHYRPHIHHVSYYRGRYNNGGHYPVPHRVRDQRTFHSYRRSDFGSVKFRPNSSVRPHNAPNRPSSSSRPSGVTRPNNSTRPSETNRPSTRPGNSTSRPRPATSQKPSRGEKPKKEVTPSRKDRVNASSRSSERRSASESTKSSRRSSSSSTTTEREKGSSRR